MILLLDNYDSFTYNIVQYLQQLGAEVVVYQNDRIKLSDIFSLEPKAIVLGPGPGTPNDAGITLQCIEYFADKLPLLGVCLGHQAIAQVFGASIIGAQKVMHGRTSFIYHDQNGVFKGLDNPTPFTRYHSLIVDNNTVPDDFIVTAWTTVNQTVNESTDYKLQKDQQKMKDLENAPFVHAPLIKDNSVNSHSSDSISSHTNSYYHQPIDQVEIMAIRHKYLPIESVQFHPESILSTAGLLLFNNFLTHHNLL